MKRRKLEIPWEKILHNQKLIAFLHREKTTDEYISQMYPRENKEKMFLTLWGKRLLVFAVLLSAVIVSAVFGFLSEPEKSRLTEGKYITRGEEDEVLVLTLLGTTGEKQWKKTVSLNVKERQFTKQEKEKLTKQTEQLALSLSLSIVSLTFAFSSVISILSRARAIFSMMEWRRFF